MLINFVIFQKIILSILLGGLIGLERERTISKKSFAGIRTFILACLFGLLSTFVSQEVINSSMLIFISFFAVCSLAILNYFYRLRSKSFGSTTELAFVITFLLGLLIYFEDFPYFLSVSIAILLTFILIVREKLHLVARHISKKEIWSAIIFGIITFILYPLMPNYGIDSFGVINPHLIWSTIIILLSISFTAYIAMKIFGAKKGLALTGIFGGLASSTGVAVNMAESVKKNSKILYSGTFAVVIASSTMFIRMLFVSSLFNPNAGVYLLPQLLLLGLSGYFLSYTILKKSFKEKAEISIKSPLSLTLAFKFAILFSFVLVISKIGQTYFGSTGIYVTSLIAGLVDVDALTVSLATLSLNSISPHVAAQGILIAALTNTFSKWLYIKIFGEKQMAFEVGRIFLVLIIQGVLLFCLLGL